MMSSSQPQASFYARYLAADWIVKKLEQLDIRLTGVKFHTNQWTGWSMAEITKNEDQHYGFMFPIAIDVESLTDEVVEQVAAEVLMKVPGAMIVRQYGFVYLYGTVPGLHEIRWHLSLGNGVCERVQVGTRKVMKADPAAPLVEVEEPIFEVRCIDPLAERVRS